MASSRSVSITYVPADCGSVFPGKSKAPQAFRDIGIVQKLRNAGIPSISESNALGEEIASYKPTAFAPGHVRNEDLNISVCKRVHQAIVQNLNDPSSANPPFQLILGGECGMSPAIMAAFWQHAASRSPPARVGLVYIDADTDMASPTDPNSTGIFAGMNMTHLIRAPGALQGMEQFTRPAGGGPVCDPRNTVLFGTNMTFAGNTPEHSPIFSTTASRSSALPRWRRRLKSARPRRCGSSRTGSMSSWYTSTWTRSTRACSRWRTCPTSQVSQWSR